MTWRSRLTNSLTKLGVIDTPAQPHLRPLGSVGVQDIKNFMTYEAMPGFSQPVFGPEISTVGAYSREGYTSRTFDTPAINFKQQAAALQVDEDAQLAINHLASQVTGGEHYVKAEKSEYVDYFTKFTEDFMFDTFDTRLVKELLWYGNSVWKPRMGIANVRRFDDLMHIPISSFVRVWWDRQRIPYKYDSSLRLWVMRLSPKISSELATIAIREPLFCPSVSKRLNEVAKSRRNSLEASTFVTGR